LGSDGEEMLARGGRTGLGSEGDDEWLRSTLLEAWEEVDEREGPRSSWEPAELAGAAEERVGDFWRVRTEESLEGRANDCSNGLGSRSKVVLRGLGRAGRAAEAVDVDGREESSSTSEGWSVCSGKLGAAWTWVAMTTVTGSVLGLEFHRRAGEGERGERG